MGRVFKTGCYGRPNEEFQKFDQGEEKSLTRPEMSFTIEEIKKRFTLQTLAYEANAANPQFMLAAESDEFDAPAVNITENYDILDARSATHDALLARMHYLGALRASGKAPDSTTVEKDVVETETE